MSAASVSCHYASLTWQWTESQRRHSTRRADGSIWSAYTGITSRLVLIADRAVIFMPFLRRFSPSLSPSPCFSALFVSRFGTTRVRSSRSLQDRSNLRTHFFSFFGDPIITHRLYNVYLDKLKTFPIKWNCTKIQKCMS